MSEETGKEEAQATTVATETKENEAAALTEDELKAVEEVKNRLKFFFSDANVRQDHFIRKLLMRDSGDSPNQVPVATLLRFNTIKNYTTNPAVVVKATKELSEILTLDEEQKLIGRVVPFTEELMDDNIPKSLYVENLPVKHSEAEDDKAPSQYAVKMEDVRDLFTKYGGVALVKLKWSSNAAEKGDRKKSRDKKRFAVGAALVEFETEESLQKAAEATLTFKDGEKVEPKEKLVLGDANASLEVALLKDFIDKRKKEKEQDPKETADGDEAAGSRKRSRDEDSADAPKFTFDWKPGCVIKLKGLPSSCDREALLDMLATALQVSVDDVKERKVYADFSRGQVEGAIRFPEFSDAIAGIAKRLKDGELKVKDEKIKDAFVLEGDDEKKYWEDFIAFKNKQIAQNAEEKRNKKFRSGRGGRRQ